MKKSILFLVLITVIVCGEEPTTTYGSGASPLLNFYQRVISPLRVGKHCSMWPSCSQYAKLQLSRTNPFSAYVHTCDRLIRCGRDAHTYSDTVINFRARLIDSPFSPPMPFTSLPLKIERRENRHNVQEGDFLYENRFYDLAFESYLSSLCNGTNDGTILKAANAAFYAFPPTEYRQKLYNLSRLTTNKRLEAELTLLLAKRYFTAKQFTHSLSLLSSFDTLYTEQGLKHETRLLGELNELYYRGMPQNHTPLESDILHDELQYIYQKLPTLPYRNKQLAGLLSVFVPGSGYLLGKRKKSALFSFCITGLTVGSSVELYRRKKPVTASLMALIASGFYFGSISGSRRSVDEYNRSLRYTTMDTLLIDIEFGPTP